MSRYFITLALLRRGYAKLRSGFGAVCTNTDPQTVGRAKFPVKRPYSTHQWRRFLTSFESPRAIRSRIMIAAVPG